MKRLKEFLNEYNALIIGLFIAFLMFKGVHSCQKINYYKQEITKYEIVIDSMQSEIDARYNDLLELENDTIYNIHALKRENIALKEAIFQLNRTMELQKYIDDKIK